MTDAPASAPHISVDDRDRIRFVTIANTSKRNALNRAMLSSLAAAFADVAAVRAVVVRGDPAGGAFSAGFDITSIDDDERARGLDPIDVVATAIEASPVPVLAAIEGACMGGAFEIAMACTIRVASPTSKLAMPPARLGLVYSARGLARFVRAASPSRVQHLFLTGDRIDALRAFEWGLVDDVTDDAFAHATRIATTIANNAPLAVSGMLDAIRRVSKPGGPTPDDVAAIDEARARTVASDDLVEGVRAFAEKRAPKFRGT